LKKSKGPTAQIVRTQRKKKNHHVESGETLGRTVGGKGTGLCAKDCFKKNITAKRASGIEGYRGKKKEPRDQIDVF